MRKTTLIVLATSLLLTSCNVMEYSVFRSYINTYYSYNDIAADLTNAGNIKLYGSSFNQHYTWDAKGKAKEVYDSLCTQNNDVSYNTKMGYIVGTNWGHAYAEDIVNIDVRSNSDFDEQHPVGTLLNDIITLISVSPKKFIDSGYQQTYGWQNNSNQSFQYEATSNNFGNGEFSSNYHPIEKKLSDITSTDMILAGFDVYCYAFLLFDSTPTLSKTHELTVTVNMTNGKTYTSSIIKTFE